MLRNDGVIFRKAWSRTSGNDIQVIWWYNDSKYLNYSKETIAKNGLCIWNYSMLFIA
jgi:hypothetical protein